MSWVIVQPAKILISSAQGWNKILQYCSSPFESALVAWNDALILLNSLTTRMANWKYKYVMLSCSMSDIIQALYRTSWLPLWLAQAKYAFNYFQFSINLLLTSLGQLWQQNISCRFILIICKLKQTFELHPLHCAFFKPRRNFSQQNPSFDESFSIPFWTHNASLWQMHFNLTHLGERLRIWHQTELCSPIILLALGKPMQSLKTIPKSPASVLIALNNDSPVASITGINPKKQDPVWSVVSSKNLTQIQMCFSQLISVDWFAKCKTSFL